ncbi:PDZ domain-containing protein [Proteiniclasticum sp.]|uniref:PDZ domain-containing protein n=1 Tax=Proteiniclasticum sp. TaxID=2053595 RepID=UPI0028A0E1CE|nr:PDZ domain-containing protein [Proteiniclasticum sp.]
MFVEILNGYFSMFYSPQILILIILVLVFYFQNIREAGLRRIVLGESEDSPLVLTFYQLIYGLAGGLIISLLAGLLDIAFVSYMEVQLIFMLTVFSVTRFSKYVNVGINVLAIFLLAFLLDREIIPTLDLINLYLFIGLSHTVHGLLMLMDRKRGFVPVLFSSQSVIRGGFRIKKTYLVPSAAGFYAMTGSILGTSVFYLSLIQLFAVNETVMTFSKKQAIKALSSIRIFIGTLILLISYVVSFNITFIYLLIPLVPVLLFSERMVFAYLESRRPPYYVSDEESIVVLEVRENTPAFQSGLRSGNRILSFDGREKPSYRSLLSFMGTLHYERGINLTVRDENDEEKDIAFRIMPGTSTGIIIVPPAGEIVLPSKEKP